MIYEEGLKELFIAWPNNDWKSWLYKHSRDGNTEGREESYKDGSRKTAEWRAQNNGSDINEEKATTVHQHSDL